MKFVVVEQQGPGTYWHSPHAYLAALPEIAPALPPGARAFATDPEHYDFSAPRCVKDLRPLALPPADDAPERFEIRFAWSGGQDEVLTIRYSGVGRVEITADDGGDVELSDHNSVRLDEVLPDEAGCSHELRLTSATVRILCADLVAEWASDPDHL
ncbi:hypothetical protein [Streptomyces virginiae]|uniref:hypothetical protein n=1 Tax=Streptomyces virginiae TaxID=1961 RepID=UPI002255B6FB|nr:hypothetical protein [Streptomyces virginiae]MCX4962701.1 hypothetical protein [Streptomyces virginiae]MCX5179336.1 hypothetical protein [Streptomyces virginiae]